MNLKITYLLFLISIQAIGQDGAISGRITSNNSPLPYANIFIKELERGATADQRGEYIIQNIPYGSYTLKVSSVGYKSKSLKVKVGVEETNQNLDISIDEALTSLNEIVVTGSRTARERKDLPIAVDVISSELYEATQSVCLAEGLNYQAGLRIESNCQTCNYTQVRMNGLQGGYTQILINSRPVFSPLTGLYGLEQIPANLIDQVEVTRGGGSALYGSGAIAGTINIITKDPQADFAEININHALIGGESQDNNLNLNLTQINDRENAGLSIYASRRQRQEYDANDDGFSELPRIMNNSLGLTGFLKPNQKLRIGLSMNAINEQREGGDMLDEAPHKRQQSESRDANILAGNLDIDYHAAANHTIKTYMGAQYTTRNHYTGFFNSDGYGNTENHTIQAGLQHNYKFNILGFSQHLISGFEYQLDDVLDQIPAYGYKIDQTTRQLGAFVQGEVKIMESLTLLGGIRANSHNLVQGVVPAPRAAIMYEFAPLSKIRLSYARGFRAPQAFDADLHIAFAGGGIATNQIDPDLAPEFSNSYTASYDFDHFGTDKAFGFTLSAFYTGIEDVFVYEELNTDENDNMTLFKTNGGQAEVYGISLEMRAKKQGIAELDAGFTIQESLNENVIEWSADIPGTRQFLRTPDHYGYFALTLRPESDLKMFWTGVYTGSMPVPHFGGAPGVDGDRLVNARTFLENNFKLAYTFTMKESESELEFNAGIQNAFNAFQNDFDRGPDRDSNYMYGPTRPRTYFLGVKYRL